MNAKRRTGASLWLVALLAAWSARDVVAESAGPLA